MNHFRALILISCGLIGLSDRIDAPNIILIVCDNLGYGDIGCYNPHAKNRTPRIDKMAAEGMRFTHCYAAAPVCTPSRAAVMTGCYPRRVNMQVGEKGRVVLMPVSRKGLHPEEITIAELLKSRGYATACIGKWHLGDQSAFLPTRQGFDYYLGIPYSDDMVGEKKPGWPPLPLMENEKVIEAPVDRNGLTKRYTEKTIEFIRENREKPFFIYLPHAMPGSTPKPFASEAFRGKSKNGPWGDSVEELDWSTGQILDELKRLGLHEKTLVLWTNDNGAPSGRGGSGAPLKGSGYSVSEGGMRMPFIAYWPGKVPSGTTCSELCTLMDLYPTLASLAGARVPDDRIIDGKDIRPLLFGEEGARSQYEAFYFYYLEQLQAVRSGKWKLYLPLQAKWQNFSGKKTRASKAELYDLEADPAETRNLARERRDIVEKLLALAEKAREDLGDVGRLGRNQRPAGFVEKPSPRM